MLATVAKPLVIHIPTLKMPTDRSLMMYSSVMMVQTDLLVALVMTKFMAVAETTRLLADKVQTFWTVAMVTVMSQNMIGQDLPLM